ncbi:hypothetical protein PR048_028835 [Dryococelus australis]|uniref:Uncharacterized protein n=1 Tax=Dryococelus australis TaxID=614101 RepID=A0ABQ9GBP7_9NEOP|nr:hypothetical protein PR048_028835 [Dryococelus australis]
MYLKKSERTESIFSGIYYEVRKIAGNLDIDLKIPQLSCEQYFRRSVHIPLLDNVITDLKDRHSMEVMNLFNLRAILPKTEIKSEDEAA